MSELIATTSPSVMIRVRNLEPDSLHGIFISRWKELLAESAEPNLFLSPDFLLPYVNSYPTSVPPIILSGEDPETGKLLGLGVFETTTATKTLPLPHLVPFRCKHMYRDGLLVSADRQDEFFHGLLSYFCRQQENWFGIEFRKLLTEEAWARRLRDCAIAYGCSFRLTPRYFSPVVKLTELGQNDLETRWSSSRRKSVRKNLNRLGKCGPVGFRLITHHREVPAALGRFLRFEHSGWKKDYGTSLLSCPQDTAFVREMIERHTDSGDVIISELTVGDQVAASAINLRSGNKLYAFKIGWNEEFAEASPGLLHEVELIRAVQKEFPGVTCADSCALADSYIGNVWPDRQTMGEGLLSITTLARGTGKLISKLRNFKHWAIDRIRPEEPENAEAKTAG